MHRPHGPQRCAAVVLLAATLLTFAGRAAGDAFDEAQPLFAAAKEAVASNHLAKSKLQGFNLGKATFMEAPDDGAALIGFDVGLGKFLNIDNIYALRAVYMTRSGDLTMNDRGLFHDKHLPKNKVVKTKVLETVHVRAKPGYAVGGVTVRSGLNINGLSVTFMRIQGRRLDPNQSYESAWIGDRTGGGEAYLGGDGDPVVGVYGCQDNEKVTALGLVFINEPAAAVDPAADAPAAVAPPAAIPPTAVRPPVKPPVRRPDDPPPAPAQADPLIAPPQQAVEPAAVPAPTAAPAERIVVGSRPARLRSAAYRLPWRGRFDSHFRAGLVWSQAAARSRQRQGAGLRATKEARACRAIHRPTRTIRPNNGK